MGFFSSDAVSAIGSSVCGAIGNTRNSSTTEKSEVEQTKEYIAKIKKEMEEDKKKMACSSHFETNKNNDILKEIEELKKKYDVKGVSNHK